MSISRAHLFLLGFFIACGSTTTTFTMGEADTTSKPNVLSNECKKIILANILRNNDDNNYPINVEPLTSQCCSQLRAFGKTAYYDWVYNTVWYHYWNLINEDWFYLSEDDVWNKCQSI
ncbi:hypothetical protein DM860_003790 [Cuscuta australis]|uniref:Uncharacterized protein n=1 Tax=Cuscuta australis TaxID=267555 RepID=A0A328DLI2_9ASTE|nr:hypothetical protein DM860_003790 [Cuscuta australis]